jgi:hypothetical protein
LQLNHYSNFGYWLKQPILLAQFRQTFPEASILSLLGFSFLPKEFAWFHKVASLRFITCLGPPPDAVVSGMDILLKLVVADECVGSGTMASAPSFNLRLWCVKRNF